MRKKKSTPKSNQVKNIFCMWSHFYWDLKGKPQLHVSVQKVMVPSKNALMKYNYSVTYNFFCRKVRHFPTARSPCSASLAPITIDNFRLMIDWFSRSYILLKSPCSNFTIQQLTHPDVQNCWDADDHLINFKALFG